MMQPLVSVVMPIYHTEEYLYKAVSSILNQTHQNLELLAICDSSQNEVISILKSFHDPRLHVCALLENTNVPVAMNYARNLIHGEYVARMDSDDISMPDRFEKEVAFLESHPDVGVVGGQIDYIKPNGHHEPCRWVWFPTSYAGILWALPKYNPIANPTVMMRADLYKRAVWDTLLVSGIEDYDYWVRLADQTKICNLPDDVLKYRLKDISTLSALSFYNRNDQRKADEAKIQKKAKGIFWRNWKRILGVD
jgi:glycosyltransferase involved in cell wall biosynthesis